jgi:hypothetical protein
MIFGFEATVSSADYQNDPNLRVFQTAANGIYLADGHYCIRHQNKNGVSFEIRQITDPSLPTLESVRCYCLSPFASDGGQVCYFGGFDCNYQSSHDTAWIYRGINLFGATLNSVSATTAQGTPVTIDVLASEPNTASYTLQSVGSAQDGTTSIVSGKVLYTPKAGFLGTDTFSCVASDGTHTTSVQVSVLVSTYDGSYGFPFNQSSGLTVVAADGTHTATLTGFTNDPAEWVPGRLGSDHALSFNGTTNYVSVNSFTGILGNASRTCTAWINTTATGQGSIWPIISWGPNTTGNKWQMNMTGLANNLGRLRLEISSGWVVGTTAINDGNWHHVAATFSNSGTQNVTDVQLYVDGVLQAVTASSSQTVNTTASGNVKIGSDNQSRFWNGTIGDARIYNRALSAAEVFALATDATVLSSTDWNNFYFQSAPANWTATDAGDGIPRLLKYAFGGQPFMPTTESVLYGGPPVVVNNQYCWGIPQLRSGTTTATYSVQGSSDLVNWNVPVTLLGTTPLNSDYETAWYQAPPAVNGETMLFLKASVTLP